jgi:GH24 family phage-related lysozyme (muramidase)
MQTSDKGIALIKQFEGCKLTAYQDSVGVWTIGYGWTQPVDGKPIRAGMTIKQETAERLLKTGWSAMKATCPAWLKLADSGAIRRPGVVHV